MSQHHQPNALGHALGVRAIYPTLEQLAYMTGPVQGALFGFR